LLDEPTNHLDVATLEWLEAYLVQHHGALLMASHDRRFIERFAQEVWDLHNGKVIRYQGGFADFLASQMDSSLPG
jgi:ATPase subunit of ABC transporter with duplicated ATPase domains